MPFKLVLASVSDEFTSVFNLSLKAEKRRKKVYKEENTDHHFLLFPFFERAKKLNV